MTRYTAQNGGKLKNAVERDKLLYWYVHTFLWGRFAASTESVLNQDLALMEEQEGALDRLIEQLQIWRGDLTVRPENFAGWSRGARFYPMLYLLTRVGNARDWGTGLPLKADLLGKNSGLQLHHIFPKAQLYKANALKKLDRTDEMVTLCEDGLQNCQKYKTKFNELLFQNYLVAGLDIFNGAAKMQADITPLATSDPDKYTAEMEKVKAEFNKSLPLLEKAYAIDPADENVKKALKQAYEILDMGAKAAGL